MTNPSLRHPAVLALVLVFLFFACVSARHENGDKLGESDIKKSGDGLTQVSSLSDATEENVNDCTSLSHSSTSESCEFDERVLIDYGPPGPNDNVRNGG